MAQSWITSNPPKTIRRLARIFAHECGAVFHHDAFLFVLYHENINAAKAIYIEDTLEGANERIVKEETLLTGVTFRDKAELVQRDKGSTTPLVPFGEKSRLSESLMFVSLKDGDEVLGGISVQSYTPGKFINDDLEKLEHMLDGHRKVASLLIRQDKGRMFRLAFDQSASMIFLTNKSGEIEFANERFLVKAGYTMEEIFGKNASILRSGKHSEEEYQQLWQCILKAEEWRGELCNKKKDGTFYWARVNISPILDDDGKLTHFLTIQEDITGQKRNERLAAVGLAASGLAHHIKNVQTSLEGSVELLEMGLTKGNEKAIERARPILKRSTQRMTRLIQNLLTLSRENPLQRTLMTLSAFSKEVITQCTAVPWETEISFDLSVSKSLPKIYADEGRLNDALLNLLFNAAEELQLSETKKPKVQLAAVLEGDELLITVADNGPGVPDDLQPHLFEPFFTTKDQQGTGLGLAITKKTVEEHGGMITFETSPAKGTTFFLRFPKSVFQPSSTGQ